MSAQAQAQHARKNKRWRVAATEFAIASTLGEGLSSLSDYYVYLSDANSFPGFNPAGYAEDCTPYCFLFNGPPIQAGITFARNPYDKEAREHNRRQELRYGAGMLFRSEVRGYSREWPLAGDTLQYAAVSYRLLQFEPYLEAGYHFLTAPKRFTFYAGLGMRLGIPVISRVERIVQTGESVVVPERPYRKIFSYEEDFQEQRTHFTLYTRLFLPLGLILKLNDKAGLTLGAEPGFSYRQMIPGGAVPAFYLAGRLGFRLSW